MLEQNTLTQQDSQRLTTALAEQKSTVTTLRTTVQQLSQDLDLEKSASRQLQASQLNHQSDLIDLQTEKEVAISQNQQLTARLTQTESAYQDSVVQLHGTASRLAETRSENQKLVQALASSEETALDLEGELAQVINEARLERQTMTQGQKAAEESLKAISIELETERASNEHLQAQTKRLDQTLAALRIDQQKNEAAHKETNARLADAQSALRSTEEENEALQHELSHAKKNAANLKEQLDQSHRQLQASQLNHQSDLIDLQTEKEVAISQNQQLTARLTQTESAYQDSVVQLHGTASRLAETRSENQKLVQALASSEETALDLEGELAQVINEARLERQTMTQGQKAAEESLKAISIELETERASNEHLQAQTKRLDQTLAALRIDQQKNEAAHKETNARLADAQSALRSTEEENEALQHELSHAKKNAANLKEQLDQSQASKASLDTGNALSDLRPVPTAGNPKPVYPRMAIRRGIEGEVRLSVSVTALGKVSRISINKPSGSAILDEAAIDSVRKWQFTPAIRDGVPTAMVVDIPIQFRLIDSRG